MRAIDAWMAGTAITKGPLFRAIDRHGNVDEAAVSDRAVALVIKEAALAIGEEVAITFLAGQAFQFPLCLPNCFCQRRFNVV